jgi:hypothetical protein
MWPLDRMYNTCGIKPQIRLARKEAKQQGFKYIGKNKDYCINCKNKG